MIEIFAGWIIGAAMTALALHFTGRLKSLQRVEATSGISAIGVDIAGNNGPKLDPHYTRLLKQAGIEL